VKLYFAAANRASLVDLRAAGATRVLVAFPELRKAPQHLAAYEGLDVFLDCGAWSIASGAIKPFTADEYAAWLKACSFPFSAVAALDDIFDGETSWTNFQRMRELGVDAIPTWHVGEPLELARRYAAASDRIAMGGLASRSRDRRLPEIVRAAMKLFVGTRVHLFGVGALRVLLAGRAADSADCTGWLFAANHGEIYTLLNWPQVRNLDVTRGSADYSTDVAMRLATEVGRYGYTMRELQTSLEARRRYNITVLLEVERRINTAAGETP
jgi:hypothetical protein